MKWLWSMTADNIIIAPWFLSDYLEAGRFFTTLPNLAKNTTFMAALPNFIIKNENYVPPDFYSILCAFSRRNHLRPSRMSCSNAKFSQKNIEFMKFIYSALANFTIINDNYVSNFIQFFVLFFSRNPFSLVECWLGLGLGGAKQSLQIIQKKFCKKNVTRRNNFSLAYLPNLWWDKKYGVLNNFCYFYELFLFSYKVYCFVISYKFTLLLLFLDKTIFHF